MSKKYVYYFGSTGTEGDAKMKWVLGGKGANLAEMTNLGIPVPPGITVTCEACNDYLASGGFPAGMMDEVKTAITKVEKEMDRTFGGTERPLLFSVRSGAPVSMPGMMDTVLNLGLTDATIEAFIAETGNARFVYDSYRRLIHMFGDVVMGVHKEKLEKILSAVKGEKGVKNDTDLTAEDLQEVIALYKTLYKDTTGEDFPQDVWEQLDKAISAVFASWNTPRAIIFRRLENIADDMGTAVNVQCMVYGNLNDNSATGVAFTRNPATGDDVFYGEYLINAQGEDVVAGTRTPQPVNEHNRNSDKQVTLEQAMPGPYGELVAIRDRLDTHYNDMQDIEFTIQDGVLYMLQTRTGKRTARAHVKIALDYLAKGIITEEEAVMRVPADALTQYLVPIFKPEAKQAAVADGKMLAKAGLPAGPGAAVGRIVFDADTAQEWANKGEKVMLVRNETTPDDIHGMAVAEGILTAFGGMTSHAALVARGMGKPCNVGCPEVKIDFNKRVATIAGRPYDEGAWISIDGTTCEIFENKIETMPSEVTQVLIGKTMKAEDSVAYSKEYKPITELADKYRKLGVRANADTPYDSGAARAFGAAGIGLTRTEHMFFKEDRIPKMQAMILADNEADRREALKNLGPLQQEDFEGIFTAMKDLPVTIRLLDPPLHEFLPHDADAVKTLSDATGISVEVINEKVEALAESNPMLGHRGCRLSVTYPEIAEMQTAAIIGAAIACKKKGIITKPEIMVPLICHVNELRYVKEVIVRTAEETMKAAGTEVEYMVGTMIEIPRAALTAGAIAEEAEFFSFGTNDLTQMGFGFSRDDIGSFIGDYTEKGVLPQDPFASLDQDGIGQLVAMSCENGRKTRPDIKLGICGEHGGEPNSIDFCHRTGLDYVSCSPFRVPIARLAAAQAAIRNK
jgi:pyruvate,orthophosphate dikinase